MKPRSSCRFCPWRRGNAYDDRNILVTGGGNGPYYLIRARPSAGVSTHFLLAVLNHPLSEALVRTNTSVFRGGYYSHGKQFIDGLPVPLPDCETRAAIDALVDRLLESQAALGAARTPRERTRLQRLRDDLRGQVAGPDWPTVRAYEQ